MISLKRILESITNTLYHVTRYSNLDSIKLHGILPNKPTDFEEDENAVYLFKSMDSLEDAIDSWLGDRFDEDEDVIVLEINPVGLNIEKSSVDYEVISYDAIPVSNIKNIENPIFI